jgi:hypothetical protein
VFCCYSKNDSADLVPFFEMLDEILASMGITLWRDACLTPGDEWDPEIQKHLDESDLAVVWLSPELLKSKYVANKEFPKMVAKRQENGMALIPVLLDHCDLEEQHDWIEAVTALPRGRLNIRTHFPDPDSRARLVQDEIAEMILYWMTDRLAQEPSETPTGISPPTLSAQRKWTWGASPSVAQ